jgi:predicted metal-dependent HD superfamily phosphohydrolase
VIETLEDRWKKLWKKLHAETVPQEVFETLTQAYSSTDRFYHNLTHIHSCFSIFDQTKFLAAYPEEVELAIWFHDAVYDTRRDDNEQKSAEWAEKVISQSGLGGGIAKKVSGLILATRHRAEVWDTDAQLLVDVDLSSLGADPETFWQYEDNIRKEYAWVPDGLFRSRRTEILRSFLNREYIYYHEQYRGMFEGKARFNLKQAVAKLSGEGSVL